MYVFSTLPKCPITFPVVYFSWILIFRFKAGQGFWANLFYGYHNCGTSRKIEKARFTGYFNCHNVAPIEQEKNMSGKWVSGDEDYPEYDSKRDKEEMNDNICIVCSRRINMCKRTGIAGFDKQVGKERVYICKYCLDRSAYKEARSTQFTKKDETEDPRGKFQWVDHGNDWEGIGWVNDDPNPAVPEIWIEDE